MKRPPVAIAVHWRDAMFYDRQMDRRSAEGQRLIECFSVGWLVYEDDDRVVMAESWFPEEDQFRLINVYPRSGILSVQYFNVVGTKEDQDAPVGGKAERPGRVPDDAEPWWKRPDRGVFHLARDTGLEGGDEANPPGGGEEVGGVRPGGQEVPGPGPLR